jgi:hypothetical protein
MCHLETSVGGARRLRCSDLARTAQSPTPAAACHCVALQLRNETSRRIGGLQLKPSINVLEYPNSRAARNPSARSCIRLCRTSWYDVLTYEVRAGLAALSLVAVLATAIVCIYFDRGMRVQARGRTQDGTSVESELDVGGVR